MGKSFLHVPKYSNYHIGNINEYVLGLLETRLDLQDRGWNLVRTEAGTSGQKVWVWEKLVEEEKLSGKAPQ